MSWYDSEAPYQYLQGPGGWGGGPDLEDERTDRLWLEYEYSEEEK